MTVAADNAFAPYVFVHEFAHHFARLFPVRAHDNPIRPLEITDRGALAPAGDPA